MEKEFEITEEQEKQEFTILNKCAETNRAALEIVRNNRAAAKRKRYNIRTVVEIGGLCALGAAVAVGGSASLDFPGYRFPVVLSCLCLSFLRFGVWLGKERK